MLMGSKLVRLISLRTEEKHMTELKKLVRHSRELWNSPLVPQHLSRHNRKAWVRSVLRLGDRWLLATKVRRIQ